MSDGPPQPDWDQRPTTPEERSHVNRSKNPASGVSLFKEGDSAWLEVGKGVIDVTIVKKVKEGGKYYYQVMDKNRKLCNRGNLVPQKDLTPN